MSQSYFCHLCGQGPMSTEQQYRQHCNGKTHKKKMFLQGGSMQADLPDDRRSTVFYAGEVEERSKIIIISDSEDEDDPAPFAAPAPAKAKVEDFPALGRPSAPAPLSPTSGVAAMNVGRGRGRGRGVSVAAPVRGPAPSPSPAPPAPAAASRSWSSIAQKSAPVAAATKSLPSEPAPAPSGDHLRPLTQSERSGNVRVVRQVDPSAAASTSNRPRAKNPKYITAKRIFGEYMRQKKTASQSIQEIAATLQWDLEEEEVVPEFGNFMNFAMRWKVNGIPCEKGQGQKKKLAKEEASRLVLKKYARLIESQGEIDPDDIEATLHPTAAAAPRSQRNPADDYKRLTMSKIDDIVKASRGTLERPVRFAAIFITTSAHQPASEALLVALGTGRCVSNLTNAEARQAYGYRLHDMQAVVIAKRAFQAYLYGQLSQVMNPTNVLGAPKYGETILEYNEQTSHFRLKPGVRVHLYMSHAPSGDATAFAAASDAANDAELSEKDLTRDMSGILKPSAPDSALGTGRLRVVVDAFRDETAILTDKRNERFPNQKTFVSDASSEADDHRIRVMSLADKIMKWNHVGVEGGLLSIFIDPIFFYSIQMGSGYVHEHVARALLSRVPLSTFPAMKGVYRNPDDPFIGRTTQIAKLRNQIEGKVSLNWFYGASNVEKVNCDDGGINADECSRLSRVTMLQRFDARWNTCLEKGNVRYPGLFRRLRPVLSTNIKSTQYEELKSFADEYERSKVTLFRFLSHSNLGHWRQKANLKAFRLLDYENE